MPTEEPSVPLTMMLSSIDTTLREIRRDMQNKAEGAALAAIELRVSALERDSASDEAVTEALKSTSTSRKAIWLSISLAIANWLVSILMVTLIK